MSCRTEPGIERNTAWAISTCVSRAATATRLLNRVLSLYGDSGFRREPELVTPANLKDTRGLASVRALHTRHIKFWVGCGLDNSCEIPSSTCVSGDDPPILGWRRAQDIEIVPISSDGIPLSAALAGTTFAEQCHRPPSPSTAARASFV
jgi:hypothetical protein